MTTYNQDGSVGPWAIEKLQCLSDYLNPYTTVMRKQPWCKSYFFFDAFAGAGRAPLRIPSIASDTPDLLAGLRSDVESDDDFQEYVIGSPGIALNLKHLFSEYYFVELDPRKSAELEAFLEPFRKKTSINLVTSDANSAIQKHLLHAGRDWTSTRGLVFLDPFGLQVPWTTNEEIAATGAIEVLINLPVGMAIQRLLPQSGKFTRAEMERLTAYFGSSDWVDVAYERTPDLFGGDMVQKYKDTGDRIAKWYAERLRKLFGYAATPRLIRNGKGGHLYYLLWAGPNKVGHKIAQHVLSQGETVR